MNDNKEDPKDSTPAKPKIPRGIRVQVTLGENPLVVYSGMRFKNAVEELTKDMTIYHGAKLSEVAEEIYKQGKKDGARSVFDAMEGVKDAIPHRNPGQPKKRRRK